MRRRNETPASQPANKRTRTSEYLGLHVQVSKFHVSIDTSQRSKVDLKVLKFTVAAMENSILFETRSQTEWNVDVVNPSPFTNQLMVEALQSSSAITTTNCSHKNSLYTSPAYRKERELPSQRKMRRRSPSFLSGLGEAQIVRFRISLHEAHESVPLCRALHYEH